MKEEKEQLIIERQIRQRTKNLNQDLQDELGGNSKQWDTYLKRDLRC